MCAAAGAKTFCSHRQPKASTHIPRDASDAQQIVAHRPNSARSVSAVPLRVCGAGRAAGRQAGRRAGRNMRQWALQVRTPPQTTDRCTTLAVVEEAVTSRQPAQRMARCPTCEIAVRSAARRGLHIVVVAVNTPATDETSAVQVTTPQGHKTTRFICQASTPRRQTAEVAIWRQAQQTSALPRTYSSPQQWGRVGDWVLDGDVGWWWRARCTAVMDSLRQLNFSCHAAASVPIGVRC